MGQNAQVIIEIHGVIFSILAMSFLLWRYDKLKNTEKILCATFLNNILMLVSDIHEISFQGSQTSLGRFMIPFSNFTLYLFQINIILFMGYYIRELVREHDSSIRSKWVDIIIGFTILNIIGLIITQITPFYYYIADDNFYHRGAFFPLCMFLAFCNVAIEIYEIIKYRNVLDREERRLLMIYYLFPSLGIIFQIFHLGISSLNIGITISIVFMLIEYEIRDHNQRMIQERVQAQSRAYLLNSQIKPHFIFNCLSVIQSLIEEEPETAQEAISHFSKFLRKNLDLKVSESTITIWEELDFTENYLYMEQLRFGDKLKVLYDIDRSLCFEIPFLSIQPLVENAVRHGIRKKIEGGTITIEICSEPKWNIVRIKDDGVGYNPDNMEEKEWDSQSNGVGIKNVEERIRMFCKGSMQIDSSIGTGTTITIKLPKQIRKLKEEIADEIFIS